MTIPYAGTIHWHNGDDYELYESADILKQWNPDPLYYGRTAHYARVRTVVHGTHGTYVNMNYTITDGTHWLRNKPEGAPLYSLIHPFR